MPMLACYFDDSGTHQGAKLVVWGGLVGGVEQIDLLDAAWRALLAAPLPGKPRLRRFHLVDCIEGAKEFGIYSATERQHLRRLFGDLIVCSGAMPVAFGVDVSAWDRLVTGRLHVKYGDAERCAFGLCAKAAFEIAQDHDEQMAVYFDQGRQSDGLRLMYEGAQGLVPEGARRCTPEFPKVADTPALQAADLCAGEFYRYGVSWLTSRDADPTPIFKALLERLEQSHFAVMGEEQISDLLAKLAADE